MPLPRRQLQPPRRGQGASLVQTKPLPGMKGPAQYGRPQMRPPAGWKPTVPGGLPEPPKGLQPGGGGGGGTGGQQGNGAGFFFNPFSNSLWSYRRPDGSIITEATWKPDRLDKTNFIDSPDGSYKLPMAGRDAAMHLQRVGATYALSNEMRPYQSAIDEHGQKYGGKTMYDILLEKANGDWEDRSNQAMASAAARGVYNSGMRMNTVGDLLNERSNKELELRKLHGDLAVQDKRDAMSDARRSFAGDLMQFLLDSHNRGQTEDLMDYLGKGGN